MRVLLASTYYGIATVNPYRAQYGGIERVNWFLARELRQMGHEVTLLGCEGTESDDAEVLTYKTVPETIEYIRQNKTRWDVLHDSTHEQPLSTALKHDMPCISTLHNPNSPGEAPNITTLSRFHRDYTMEYWKCDSRVVYNGTPGDYYTFYPAKERYVGLMGVMEKRKGVMQSIIAAKQAGVPIKLAGLKSADADYQREINALTDGKSVIWCGQLSGKEKLDFIGNAMAMMLCVFWPEPGSYLGVEAMAMGTPLIVNEVGCPQEYVARDETGIVIHDSDQIAGAIERVASISPEKVRQRWADMFTSRRMAKDYVTLYEKVLSGESW